MISQWGGRGGVGGGTLIDHVSHVYSKTIVATASKASGAPSAVVRKGFKWDIEELYEEFIKVVLVLSTAGFFNILEDGSHDILVEGPKGLWDMGKEVTAGRLGVVGGCRGYC